MAEPLPISGSDFLSIPGLIYAGVELGKYHAKIAGNKQRVRWLAFALGQIITFFYALWGTPNFPTITGHFIWTTFALGVGFTTAAMTGDRAKSERRKEMIEEALRGGPDSENVAEPETPGAPSTSGEVIRLAAALRERTDLGAVEALALARDHPVEARALLAGADSMKAPESAPGEIRSGGLPMAADLPAGDPTQEDAAETTNKGAGSESPC